MDPSDPKFQLLVGMMSSERQRSMRPKGGCASVVAIVVAAVILAAACLLVAILFAR